MRRGPARVATRHDDPRPRPSPPWRSCWSIPRSALAQQPPAKQPTAVGRGGAAATVDALGTRAAIADPAPRRQRGRRRRGRGRGARRGRALLLRHRRRRLHGHPHARRQGHHDRLARAVARGDASPTRSSRTAPSSPSTTRATAACRPASPARSPAGTARCAATGPGLLRQVLRPASASPRDGFVVDETFVSQTEPNVPWFDDIPSTARLYLDPDGTPRDVGTVLRNPDLARTYRRIARRGPDGFYPGAGGRGDRRRGPPAAGRPGRRPRLAPGPA